MVYAIIRTGGKQHRVSVGDRVDVERLPIDTGNTVEIDQVLAVGEGETLQVGTPTVAGARVVCEVVRQDRDRKVLVGKYKRRKGYYRKKGHRQYFTRLRVDSILAEGIEETAPAAAIEEPVAVEEPVEEEVPVVASEEEAVEPEVAETEETTDDAPEPEASEEEETQ